MKLTDEVKNKIIKILDSKEFIDNRYTGVDEKTKEELGMVYTPGTVCIQMIERFECETFAGKTILDPTCGSGNLLIACIIAGADIDKVFGNEYNYTMVKLCRFRINRACDLLGKPHIQDWQIHRGTALDSFCLTEFGPEYKQKLKEHYQEQNSNGVISLFGEPELTKEQEEFLAEVD